MKLNHCPLNWTVASSPAQNSTFAVTVYLLEIPLSTPVRTLLTPSRVPTPGNLPSKAKKNANTRGSARRGSSRGGGGGGRGEAEIDWRCITTKLCINLGWYFLTLPPPDPKNMNGWSMTKPTDCDGHVRTILQSQPRKHDGLIFKTWL